MTESWEANLGHILVWIKMASVSSMELLWVKVVALAWLSGMLGKDNNFLEKDGMVLYSMYRHKLTRSTSLD